MCQVGRAVQAADWRPAGAASAIEPAEHLITSLATLMG
jgi:hypothetical protein